MSTSSSFADGLARCLFDYDVDLEDKFWQPWTNSCEASVDQEFVPSNDESTPELFSGSVRAKVFPAGGQTMGDDWLGLFRWACKGPITVVKDSLMDESKRSRSPPWSSEEKHIYLCFMEALGPGVVGKARWKDISQGLLEHGFVRSPVCCEYLWGTMRGYYFAIARHENTDPQTSINRVSYFDMSKDERSEKKLPLLFPLEWFKVMEKILAAQEKLSGTKSKGIAVQESLADEGDDQHSNQQRSPSERPLRLTDRRETSNSKYAGITDTDDLMASLPPVVKHVLADAISSWCHENDIMTQLTPYFKKCIQDVLESRLEPVASASQVQDQEDKEFEEKLRVIAESKRALDCEEKELKRQRLEQQKRTQKTKSYKQRGARGVRKSSAKGIIPVKG